MSGSTIGAVAGGAIGFVVSGFNPTGFKVGWMIGPNVGACIDPEIISLEVTNEPDSDMD